MKKPFTDTITQEPKPDPNKKIDVTRLEEIARDYFQRRIMGERKPLIKI